MQISKENGKCLRSVHKRIGTLSRENFCNLSFGIATGKDGILNHHVNCVTHMQTYVTWHQYKSNTEHRTSISKHINSARFVILWHRIDSYSRNTDVLWPPNNCTSQQ